MAIIKIRDIYNREKLLVIAPSEQAETQLPQRVEDQQRIIVDAKTIFNKYSGRKEEESRR